MIDYPARLDRVRARLGELDALVVTDLTNVRWLTGVDSSNAWVVIGPETVTFGTDGRYAEQAAAQLQAARLDATIRVATTGAALRAELLGAVAAASTVGFEAAHVTVAEYHHWERAGARPWVRSGGQVEAARRCKDADEIATIRRACAIADAALGDVLPSVVAGMTEAQLRNALEARMRELGADGPSYETIVASGPDHGARPHHRPTARPLQHGDLIVIDVGALVDGYHSDMTRTVVLGDPTAEQVDAYELVLAAQLAGLDAVRPGVAGRDVDRACRDVIAAAGKGEWFVHGTGHGVGLQIHEDPYASVASEDVLAEGDVVTVEPGVYRGGFGGIRIEDLVVVTSAGCQLLTTAPKDSPCLPSPPTT